MGLNPGMWGGDRKDTDPDFRSRTACLSWAAEKILKPPSLFLPPGTERIPLGICTQYAEAGRAGVGGARAGDPGGGEHGKTLSKLQMQ